MQRGYVIEDYIHAVKEIKKASPELKIRNQLMVGFPGEPRLDIYRRFTGWCDEKSVPIKDLQVDMLLDTPVRLGKLRHVIFGDQVDVFEFDTVFTLFELVEGVGWELGFHGTPRECQIRR